MICEYDFTKLITNIWISFDKSFKDGIRVNFRDILLKLKNILKIKLNECFFKLIYNYLLESSIISSNGVVS